MDSKFSVPTAYIWRKSGLYLGSTYVPARDIKLTTDQLVVCLKGEIVTTREDGSQFSARTFLLKAGTISKASTFDSTGAIVAICYLNPISQDYPILKNLMAGHHEDVYYQLEHEERLIEVMIRLRDDAFVAEEAAEVFRDVLIPESKRDSKYREFDKRIITVIKRIEETVQENKSVRELADEVCLSESRLVKLFKSQIGIPITRYRLRYRVFLGVVHMSLGSTVTNAALLSGFASTAHFSRCYVAMMGIQPSTAFLHSPFLKIIIADEITRSISENSKPSIVKDQTAR